MESGTVYRRGEAIYRIGDRGGHMYVVLRGEVELLSDGQVVELVGANGTFGEVAMIEDGAVRGDRALAKTDVEVIALDRPRFLALAQTTPSFALKVMRTVVTRARARAAGPRVALAS